MSKKRSYHLKKRAERQAETRLRIAEATAALHREIGPAATNISAIAERAGVERLTVIATFQTRVNSSGPASTSFALLTLARRSASGLPSLRPRSV